MYLYTYIIRNESGKGFSLISTRDTHVMPQGRIENYYIITTLSCKSGGFEAWIGTLMLLAVPVPVFLKVNFLVSVLANTGTLQHFFHNQIIESDKK